MKNQAKENEITKEKKKLSAFQITAIVLIAILFVVIIVQIGLIINYKNKTDDLNEKNNDLPTVQEVTSVSIDNFQDFTEEFFIYKI